MIRSPNFVTRRAKMSTPNTTLVNWLEIPVTDMQRAV
ncbi:MAG TPA: glyoxalase, partial [Cupriavidus sp.]|nr:glyoxalase [Cupriavidus sp.]